MKPPIECRQPAYHEMHLCILQHINQQEVDKLTVHPTHYCLRCNLKADQAKNLCQPKKL